MSATKVLSIDFDRDELAALALLTERPELLRADGRLGLMHIGADLDGGLSRLAERGVIRPDGDHRVNPHRPLGGPVVALLGTIDAATRQLHVIFDGDQLRYSDSVYIDGDNAVLLDTLDTVAASSFRLTPMSASDAVDALCGRLGLEEGTDEGPTPVIELSLSAMTMGSLNQALEQSDFGVVTSELEASGLSVRVAYELATGMSRGRRAVEFHVSRRLGSDVRMGYIFWNVLGDGTIWEFTPIASERSVSLVRTSRALVSREISRLVEWVVS